ncbi:hypothetical protein [Rubripirellula obstinata]|uniref:hypothetical protein n=1 Tax=Rubripirellula obstinata TaxID=406547 RepID=UPI00082EEC7F|nr:hypothetical protein [Rubripirellula obstinata]
MPHLADRVAGLRAGDRVVRHAGQLHAGQGAGQGAGQRAVPLVDLLAADRAVRPVSHLRSAISAWIASIAMAKA